VQTCAHYIALDDFGGLQTLYAAWAKQCISQSGHPPVTIHRARNPPLPEFTESFRRHGVEILVPEPASSSKLRGHFLKLFRRAPLPLLDLVRRNRIDRVISWNAMPPKELAGRSVTVYDHGLSWIQRPNARRIQQMNLADRFVSISRASSEMLRQRWKIEKPITVVPNPLRWQGDPIQRPLRQLEGQIVIGCAGRLLSFKGFSSVLHAVQLLRGRGLDVILQLAGDGEEEHCLRQLSEQLNIHRSVSFLGRLDDIRPFFAGLDVFVCPSLREPFGLVSIEAMACAVPTILSHVDGLGETMPTPESATLLEPTVSLDDYVRLGGSLRRMPAEVFDPKSGTIRAPLALAKEDIADAVEMIVHDYAGYQGRANQAAKDVAREYSLQVYADRIATTVCGLE